MAKIKTDTIHHMVELALAEDCGMGDSYGDGDITAALLPEGQQAHAEIITREAMVLCGQAWVNAVFHHLDPGITIQWQLNEGEKAEAGQTLCVLQGPSRALLTGERTALNFLQTLSATATKTAQFVAIVQGTGVAIVDTRKTLPLWREAQKYAVHCGGGVNHRMGLYDAFLIKENHIAACGSIEGSIEKAKALYPDHHVQVEVETLEELEQALQAQPDSILLDNFSLAGLKKAVELTQKRTQASVPLEASGGIELANLLAIAETGVQRISLGCLTKHIQAVDLSMRLVVQ